MIFPQKSSHSGAHDLNEEAQEEDPILVPLAVPLLAGPSAMAFVILSSSQHPDKLIMLLLALLIASVGATVILLLSDSLRRILGNQILRAIERLMGMILTTMAIQMPPFGDCRLSGGLIMGRLRGFGTGQLVEEFLKLILQTILSGL